MFSRLKLNASSQYDYNMIIMRLTLLVSGVLWRSLLCHRSSASTRSRLHNIGIPLMAVYNMGALACRALVGKHMITETAMRSLLMMVRPEPGQSINIFSKLCYYAL